MHLSADGKDAIIHDATLDRTAQDDSPLRTGAVVEILHEQLPDEAWDDPGSAPAVVLSVHEEPLRRTRERDARIPLMRTTTVTTAEWWDSCRDLGVTHVGVRISDAHQVDVERAAELGAALNLWTARSEEELDRALELGCDTLTVDDPLWAVDLLSRRLIPAG